MRESIGAAHSPALSSLQYPLLMFGGLGPHFAKAITAIDWPVRFGLEGNNRIGAALGAHDGVHITWRVLIHGATCAERRTARQLRQCLGSFEKPRLLKNSCSPTVKINSPSHSTQVRVLSDNATGRPRCHRVVPSNWPKNWLSRSSGAGFGGPALYK